MSERQSCSNCGAPVTRNGTDTRATCPHCQNVVEFAPVAPPPRAAAPPRGNDGFSGGGNGGGGSGPNIVIIQAPAPIQAAPPPPQRILVQAPGAPRVIERPVIIVRRSYAPRIIGPILFILLFVGISTYIRMRANRAVESVESAEKSAERSAEKGEHAAEKKPPGHH